jgi:hypothetical protein
VAKEARDQEIDVVEVAAAAWRTAAGVVRDRLPDAWRASGDFVQPLPEETVPGLLALIEELRASPHGR